MNEKQKKPQAFWRMCLVALICMLSSTLYAQNITVTGTVKDPMGEPVIGASVSVQGTRGHRYQHRRTLFHRMFAASHARILVSWFQSQECCRERTSTGGRGL